MSKSIIRAELLQRVVVALRRSPIVGLLGPRQCGKTTLARDVAKKFRLSRRFDLESPRDESQLRNPQVVLEREDGLVILDEIQRRPDLMPLLRVLADRRPRKTHFLLLGSASPELVRHSSESLAGRIEFVEMGGFSLPEVGKASRDRLWLRGGFPPAFLSPTAGDSMVWRENFIATFLERDLPQLGVQIPAPQLRRFWSMVAHLHGQLWNASEIGGSLGITHPTARRYLDLLTGAFMVRQLQPWFSNTGKRLVKAPKIYVRDTGLLHALLNLDSMRVLEGHPKWGASWEGFAMEQILRRTGERETYFWATHGGAELDLLIIRKGKRLGFEFKASEAPTTTKSMHVSLADLKLDHLAVVYPGAEGFPMDKKINAMSLSQALESL